MSIVALLAMLVSVIVPATAFASDDDATDTSGPITPAANDIEQLPAPPPDEPIDDPLEAAEPSVSGLAPPDFDDPIILDDTEPQPEDLEGGLEEAGEPADPADLAEEADGEGVDDSDLLDALGLQEPDGLEALEDEELEETSTPGGICSFDLTSEMKLDNDPRGVFALTLPLGFAYEGTLNPAWAGITLTVGDQSVSVTGGTLTLCVNSATGNAEVTLNDGESTTTASLGLTGPEGQDISHIVIRSGSPTQPELVPWLPEKVWDFGGADVPTGTTATIILTDPGDPSNTQTYVFTGVPPVRDNDTPLELPEDVEPLVDESYSAGDFVCEQVAQYVYPSVRSIDPTCVQPQPDPKVVVTNTCTLPPTDFVRPDKSWDFNGFEGEGPYGYAVITITTTDGLHSKTWNIRTDGSFIGDAAPLEIPEGAPYEVIEEGFFLDSSHGEGWICEMELVDNGNGNGTDSAAATQAVNNDSYEYMPVYIHNDCVPTYFVRPEKTWDFGGLATPSGYADITFTPDDGVTPAKTWRFDTDGTMVTTGGFDNLPLELPFGVGYTITETFSVSGFDCTLSDLGIRPPEELNGLEPARIDNGNDDLILHAVDIHDLANRCRRPPPPTIRIPPPEIPEPEVEIEFTKSWLGVDDVDMTGVEVTFLVDGDEVALGQSVSVEAGQTLTIDEAVAGLPAACSYTSDIPATYTVPEDAEDGDVYVIEVTNDVTCVLPTPVIVAPPFDDPIIPPLEPEPEPEPLPEPEPEEPEVLPEIIDEPEAEEPTEVADVIEVATPTPLPRTGASTALLSLIAMLLLATGTTLLRRRRGSTR